MFRPYNIIQTNIGEIAAKFVTATDIDRKIGGSARPPLPSPMHFYSKRCNGRDLFFCCKKQRRYFGYK